MNYSEIIRAFNNGEDYNFYALNTRGRQYNYANNSQDAKWKYGKNTQFGKQWHKDKIIQQY